ncbi:hypothetical protein [Longispora urticae]
MHIPPTSPCGTQPCHHQATLTRLQAAIRTHIAGAAIDEIFTIEQANALLERFEQQPLNRLHTINLTLPMTIEVRAGSAEEATDAAMNMLEYALNTVDGLEMNWQNRDADNVEPGEIDTDNP